MVVSGTPEGFGCCIYMWAQNSRESQIGFCNLKAFRQEEDYEAAGKNQIFISLVCSTFKCLDGFSSRVAQALPQRHVNSADYIGLGGLA